MKDNRLDEILDKVSGVFDAAYEFSTDDEDRDYINVVENELREYLKEKGLI